MINEKIKIHLLETGNKKFVDINDLIALLIIRKDTTNKQLIDYTNGQEISNLIFDDLIFDFIKLR